MPRTAPCCGGAKESAAAAPARREKKATASEGRGSGDAAADTQATKPQEKVARQVSVTLPASADVECRDTSGGQDGADGEAEPLLDGPPMAPSGSLHSRASRSSRGSRREKASRVTVWMFGAAVGVLLVVAFLLHGPSASSFSLRGTDSTFFSPKEGSIVVSKRQLLVDGVPFHIKGINWNPIPKGATEPADRNLDKWHMQYVAEDGDLMAAAGINVLRTYGPLTNLDVLDSLWVRGIRVMNTVYFDGQRSPKSVIEIVEKVKHHPAILMWVIGNEWNYNGIYAQLSHRRSMQKLNEAAKLIKEHDPTHPVSTIYGGMPSGRTVRSMPHVDIWGLNVYGGLSFGSTFKSWKRISEKPMYFGEYGADAFNAIEDREDQEAQALATKMLTQEIMAHTSVLDGGICLGGLLFEFADEWWKDSHGSPDVHDNHGVAPGVGPHPDKTFNEEWWGIVDIDRKPRLAYYEYQRIPNPAGGVASV